MMHYNASNFELLGVGIFSYNTIFHMYNLQDICNFPLLCQTQENIA